MGFNSVLKVLMSKDTTEKPTSTERVKYLHCHLQGMMLIRPLLVTNKHNMNISHSPSLTHTHTHTPHARMHAHTYCHLSTFKTWI